MALIGWKLWKMLLILVPVACLFVYIFVSWSETDIQFHYSNLFYVQYVSEIKINFTNHDDNQKNIAEMLEQILRITILKNRSTN